jgi:hypothetical protein
MTSDGAWRARSGWAALGALLGLAAQGAEPKPTAAALDRAFQSNQASVVEVVGPHRRGTGVLVGADGRVLTSSELVGLESARVRVADKDLPAKVLMANPALKVALVAIDGGGSWRAAPVSLEPPLQRGDWLVGIRRSRKGDVIPAVGQVSRAARAGSPFLEADVSLAPGSPLFDRRGRLVAISVQARTGGCKAVALPAVKLQLAQEATP